jgi:hypothetical protein
VDAPDGVAKIFSISPENAVEFVRLRRMRGAGHGDSFFPCGGQTPAGGHSAHLRLTGKRADEPGLRTFDATARSSPAFHV